MWLIDLILIAVACFFCLKIIQIYGARAILLVWTMLTFAQQIASTIYLNTGVYVNELGRTTYYVAKSTPLFILYVDIFLFFLVCFGKNKMSISRDAVILESTNLSTLVCYSSLLLTIALAGYTILDMLVSGIPMMTSVITHYNYYTTYSRLPMASTINNLLGTSMYLLGYAYVHIDKKHFRRICVLLVLSTMIVRFMLGYKMSGLIDIPLNFIAVAVLLSKVNFKTLRQVIKPQYVLLGLVIALGVVALFVFSVISSGTADDASIAFRVFMNRAFGLGNHLWWSAEADTVSGNSLFGHNLLAEFDAILTGKSPYDVSIGMYHLMKKYGDSYIVGVDIKHQIRYAATFITTAVYNFGYFFAPIQLAINAKIMIWFISSIDRAVKEDRFFQLLLLCKVWGTFSTFITATGTMTEWLNLENYFYLLLCFILRCFVGNRRFEIRIGM